MLEGLNPRQADAVRSISGSLLVVAGAGTGKTRVITLRIGHMIAEGVDPAGIVGLSFTNKAAAEMRERLAHLVGSRVAKRVTLSTFHSFALGILREFPEEVGLRPGFGIVDDADSSALMRDAVRENDLGEFFDVPYMRHKVGEIKDQLLTLQQLRSQKTLVDSVMIASVFESYERRLRLYNLVDFDDLVYLSWRILQSSPATLAKLRRRWSHFLVDEFQDTSMGQFEFLKTLVSCEGNICAVGDDDQSIYGWRGANPRVLKVFLETFSGARQVTLDQNYRCSPVILEAANAVVCKNSGRLEKELWSERSDRLPLVLYSADSEADEARFVAEVVQSNLLRGVSANNMAVLFRSRAVTSAIEHSFDQLGIPFTLTGNTRLADRREIRDVMALVHFSLNAADLRALFRSLEVLGWRSPASAQESIAQSLGQERRGSHEFLCRLDQVLQARGGFAQLAWQSLAELRLRLLACESTRDVAALLESWFSTSELKLRLRTESASMKVVLAKEEMMERFFGIVRQLSDPSESSAAKPPLEQITDRFGGDSLDLRREEEGDQVQFLTIHSAKGLEFDTVFLMGLEEGVLPHERSLEEGSEEEERRLMYVAMTRAKKRLYLSHARYRYGSSAAKKHKQSVPSRFLHDIPAELQARQYEAAEAPALTKQQAAKRLFQLFRQPDV